MTKKQKKCLFIVSLLMIFIAIFLILYNQFFVIKDLQSHKHLIAKDHSGKAVFCEFLSSELVSQVIWNNIRYFVAYMISALGLFIIMLIFWESFSRFFVFIWGGVAKFIFGCGVGHLLRALIFSTNNPNLFWIEAYWELYFSYWSILISILVILVVFRLIIDEFLQDSAEMFFSLISYHFSLFRQTPSKEISDVKKEVWDSIHRLQDINKTQSPEDRAP